MTDYPEHRTITRELTEYVFISGSYEIGTASVLKNRVTFKSAKYPFLSTSDVEYALQEMKRLEALCKEEKCVIG